MSNKITIDGMIGFDVDNTSISAQLKAAKGEGVTVEIASPGGMISEGLKIYNSLKNYKGRVDTHLTGSVASMATYIAMVGERRTAEKNATFMIHNGRTIAAGDHNTMFKVGRHLEALSNIIAKEYTEKTGTPLDQIRAAMDEETFYYGDEIQAAGFVHEVVGDATPGEKAEAVAAATLMVEECQKKITPESLQEDIVALATMKIEAQPSAKPQPHKDEDFMEYTIEGLAKDAPELLAEIEATAKAEGVKEGKKEGAESESSRVLALAKAHFGEDGEKFEALVTSGVNLEQYKAMKDLQPEPRSEEDLKAQILAELEADSAGDPGSGEGGEGPKDFMAAAKAIKESEGCTQKEAFSKAAKDYPELYEKHTGGK